MLYGKFINNMNSSLSELLELNEQASSQKRVNRPSDDPTGMTRILGHRDVLRSLDQYKENISTARGWLQRSDDSLHQVSTIITRAKELATQAASGTVSGDNREQISYELRSLLDQLIGLSNTSVEGQRIYGGHRVDQPAYVETLWMTTNDPSISQNGFKVTGSADNTVLVQWLDSGDIGGANDLQYRYSMDGGKSFTTATLAAGDNTLNMGGVSLQLENGTTVTANSATNTNDASGTWMWVRPTARYMGDDNESLVVDKFGTGTDQVSASASGNFSRGNVTIRIDNTSAVRMDQEIEYSFSFDGGVNWIEGNKLTADLSASNAVFSIADSGNVLISQAGTQFLQPGAQFTVRPSTADIYLDISATEQVRVNDVGWEIFGGVYQDPNLAIDTDGTPIALASSNAKIPFASNASAKWSVTRQGSTVTTQNLFETIGNLIAFTETNNQTGVQQQLANLEVAHEKIMNIAANVGGRENRLTVGESIIDGLNYTEKNLMSNIEDIDISELMTELTQQQIVYETVLRSTSTIMQLNLSKFV